MGQTRRLWPLIAVVGVFVFLIIGWPLVRMVRVAAEEMVPGDVASVLADDSVVHTLVVGLAAACLTAFIGVGSALLTETTAVAGSRWLRTGIMTPILVPPFVSAMSWLRAYGPSGLVDDLIGWEMPGLMGPVGIVLVISVNAVPLAYLLTAAAIRTRADRELEIASRVSGAGPGATIRHITLPLLRTAILGVAALAFVVGINAFGVPALLGTPASFDTMTTRIYQDLARSARPEAFERAILLATALAIIAVVFVSIGETLAGDSRRRSKAHAAGSSSPPMRGGATLLAIVWVMVVAGTVIPLVALVLVSLTRGVGLPPTPANWTLAHYAEAMDSRYLGALGRSVLLAAVTATMAVALGGAISGLRGGRGGRWAGVAVLAGFAIPGSALAVAVLLGYGRWLRDTLLLILIAYLAKLWAVAHRSIDGSVGNLASDSLRAARVSGAGPVTALRTVAVPLLRPAIAGGWALVFLIAFHELTMSALLHGPGTDTLAVALLNVQQVGDVPLSSAMAVILTLPLVLLALPILAPRTRSARWLAMR